MTNKHNRDFQVDESKLNSSGQQAVRKIVQAIPEDSLSMAWRSSLNEQLLASAVKQRKRQRWIWFAKPALGLSMASILAVAVMFHPSTKTAPVLADRGIESAIMLDHHNSALLNDVSSAGLNANEVTSAVNTQDPDEGVWSESDVQSL